jgi:hypothetical protein
MKAVFDTYPPGLPRRWFGSVFAVYTIPGHRWNVFSQSRRDLLSGQRLRGTGDRAATPSHRECPGNNEGHGACPGHDIARASDAVTQREPRALGRIAGIRTAEDQLL